MSNERDAEQIFYEARERDPAERSAFVAGACGSDDAMRAEVDSLLEAEAAAGSFLETVGVDATNETEGLITPFPREQKSEKPGQMLDRYKLLEPIGEGGFGSVWLAEQREPVKRRVALKIIKLGMDTKEVIARFEAERQALAMMDHPNIARVLEAGSTDTGRPYFVMELVRGIPILDYCNQEKLDTRQRLALFVQICQAIQHAHQKGIIHRDIKPSNVLVTMHDGVPVVKVIDFGIAKATNTELTTKTLFTQHRQMIGTPVYMSPEQAEMSGLDIDTRSDVYSLGVLLYELLTGSTPFDTQELLHDGFAEMLRIIREREPQKPSTRLSTLGDNAVQVAEQRRADPGRLGLLLRGDLDWIIMKCLEKDRTRRYETANALSIDIQRHLSDEPVSASPPSQVYRLRKFVRRNRASVTAVGIVVSALVIGFTVAILALTHSMKETENARKEKRRADLALDILGGKEASIAILSLENRTGDASQDYIVSGVTMWLAEDLDRTNALRVVSDGSSSLGTKATEGLSLEEIAQKLGVHGVVTGWVERQGSMLRLKIQLVHALRGELWEHEYSEDLARLQHLQRRISRDIVNALSLDWTEEDGARLSRVRSESPEAIRAYMKGSFLLRETTLESSRRALEQFEMAVSLDPEFAAAHAGIANAYHTMENAFLAPKVTMPPQKRAVLRALELDPTLPEANYQLGLIHLNYDWDWDAARARFAQSTLEDPEFAPGHIGTALYHAAMARPDEAIAAVEMAIDHDPNVLIGNHWIYVGLYMTRDFDLTEFYATSGILLDESVWFPFAWRAMARAELGRLDEAYLDVLEAERLATREGEDTEAAYLIATKGMILGKLGRHEEAREVLRRMEELEKTRFVCPYEIAVVHIALGELDESIRRFHHAIMEQSNCIPWFRVDARIDGARDHEGFQELLEKTGHVPHPL